MILRSLFTYAAIALFAALDSVNATAADQPNFVVIFCDDLGYGDLSTFGHPTIKTPHIG